MPTSLDAFTLCVIFLLMCPPLFLYPYAANGGLLAPLGTLDGLFCDPFIAAFFTLGLNLGTNVLYADTGLFGLIPFMFSSGCLAQTFAAGVLDNCGLFLVGVFSLGLLLFSLLMIDSTKQN